MYDDDKPCTFSIWCDNQWNEMPSNKENQEQTLSVDVLLSLSLYKSKITDNMEQKISKKRHILWIKWNNI